MNKEQYGFTEAAQDFSVAVGISENEARELLSSDNVERMRQLGLYCPEGEDTIKWVHINFHGLSNNER